MAATTATGCAGSTAKAGMGDRRRRLLAGAALPLALMALAAAPDARAQAVIDGPDVVTVPGDRPSPWELSSALTVGETTTGTLAIETGGVVSSVGGVIGDGPAAIGLVTLTGSGALWTSGDLTVGREGDGGLGIFDGGMVESLDTVVGAETFSFGDILVQGAGSAWNIDGAFTLGLDGEGDLQILDGATVSAGPAVFGANLDGSGEAWLSGDGSLLEVDSLVLGDSGFGGLTLSDGAVLSVGDGAGTITLGQTIDGSGLLSIGGDCGCGPAAPEAPGILDAALVQFGPGGGELGFNHTSTDYAFDAEIAGTGLVAAYSGTTTLTADSSGFTGTVGVGSPGGLQFPHLIVDGVLGGDPLTGEGSVVVTGGALSGAGAINGLVLVDADGVLRGVSGQTLTMGELVLGPDATVEADLGGLTAPVLFDVRGDLFVDGALDLTGVPGSEPGVHRLMTYGGVLTDNGLTIGATPVGVDPLDYAVQTAVSGQVNLVSGIDAGDFVFWDGGDAALHGNGSIDGGAGVWSTAAANWTEISGAANAAMTPQPGFAIFQAAPGTVTVDASGGVVSATGMQFASDGYLITGDAISLTEAASVVRVGDGTTAGATYTATIESALTGTGGLRKTDLGTLVLTGDSTYSGDTLVHGGLLRVDGGSLGGDGQDLQIGAIGSAELEIANGGVVTAEEVRIGSELGEAGLVTVSGAGSQLISDSDLNVGYRHDGMLVVEDGGVVQARYGRLGSGDLTGSGSGVLVVTGAGSLWDGLEGMTVGQAATGVMTVENGGSVQLGGALDIGDGSNGFVTITGSGSSLDVDGVLTAGLATSGELTIADGAVATATSAVVGQEATASGEITVDGAGSSLTLTDGLVLGFDGEGSLLVSDGGRLSAASLILGQENTLALTGDGSAEVTGVGSLLDIGSDVVVGENGVGSLIVSDGGVVRADGGAGAIILGRGGLDELSPASGTLLIGGGGAAPLAAGVIDAARVEFGAGFNSGSITFHHNESDYVFAPDIVGGVNAELGDADHSLVFSAGGTRLTGDSSGFTGTTTVMLGAGVDAALRPHLMVDGVLGGDVNVNAGGALSGSGSITGPVSINAGGTLIGLQGQTLTMGDLTLNSGSTIDVQLGALGGAALFDVVGDLTLDGAVDVTDAGGYGPGIYSLITYGGDLIDNGLDIGLLPVGFDLAVQTAVDGQVNLVSAIDGDLLFWDGGDATLHANGAVDGGSGVWSAVSPTWTDMDGLGVGAMTPQPGFAIFQAAPGVVTLDDSAGALAVTGMQFAVDGYRLEGDALVLADSETIVRVGNGTVAGADFTATIDSEITGAGALVKTDLGTLVLTGDSSAFGGGTFVNEGMLMVDGALGGLVTVDAGGAVGGTGQLGSLTLGDGAVVSPGNSIGTLNIAGDIVFDAGSVYEVEVEPGGTASDLIHAGGTATLGGATVSHIGEGGGYAPFQTYTILTADGGLIGTFGTVTSDFAFLDPSLTYDPNNVYLTLLRNDISFAGIGDTPNQIATGAGVESLGFGNPVWDAAVMLSEPAARDAFDQLSGEFHPSVRTAAVGQVDRVRRTAINQVRLDRAPERGLGLWVEGWGALDRYAADGNAARLRHASAGLLVGAHGQLGGGWTVGVAAGAEKGDVRTLARRSEGDIDTVHLLAYGGGELGPLGVRLGASHSRHQIDVERTVDFPGFSDTLDADYDARTTQLFAEAGYAFAWGRTEVEPFASVAHIDLEVDGFSENGGAAALTAEAESQQVTLSTFGVGMSRSFDNGPDRQARLHGRIGWRHASGDVTPQSRFTLAGGTPFIVAGVPIAEEAVVGEIGLDVQRGGMTAGVVWSGQAGDGMESHALQGRLSWRF